MSDHLSAYHDLIAAKRVAFQPSGLKSVPALNSAMRGDQQAVTAFALECGRSALFLDTGLGKTFDELEWGRVVVEHANRPVLMLAPLACAKQHEREAEKFGIDARAIREPGEMDGARVYITNYDRLDRFEPDDFAGVVLDESSILKSFTGQTTRKLIERFSRTPFRLAGTATPAPNDHTELGQHSAFLGVMPQFEMLARWFLHDSANTGTWRMKGHAVAEFWDWVTTWGRCVSKPSDLGFSDAGFDLPPLNLHRRTVRADVSQETGSEKGGQGRLFRLPETSATSIHREKRLTIAMRADTTAEAILAEPGEAWVVWCDTDYEAADLGARLPGAVEVRGSMTPIQKERRLDAFSRGETSILISKPSICGFGLNWQHCARMAFVGLSFSYESFYQAIRRSWRFGQTRPVDVHVACADTEEAIWAAVNRKGGDHEAMKAQMSAAMLRAVGIDPSNRGYSPALPTNLPTWIAA